MILQPTLLPPKMNPQRVCTIEDEWFTPASILRMAKISLDSEIYWDLASCPTANESVGAENYFSKSLPFQDYNYQHEWRDNFWCNPPFSQIAEFAEIITHTRSKSGILLSNANTDTAWFHALAQDADHLWLSKGRIGFIDPATGKARKGNPKGQAAFFWGCDPSPWADRGTLLRLHR